MSVARLDTAYLLPLLDEKLMSLLHALTPDEWQAQTIAKKWKVKDVVAHLLDGNIRILSILRDGYYGESPNIQSYQDLVDFLNQLNADWVTAMRRVSPQMLIMLHTMTGPPFCRYYQSLDPMAKSGFPVDWAGEKESRNWFHIAREYTEKWLHQQQIRDAVDKPGIMTRQFYYPFIDTLMHALPHTFRHMDAAEGTSVAVTISSSIGGTWLLERTAESWHLVSKPVNTPVAAVNIDPDSAWKLFSKSRRAADVIDRVRLEGDQALGRQVLEMVAVMA